MRVALVHDYLNQYGGAERVLEAFCEIWPDAPIYTLIYNKKRTGEAFEGRRIHTSFLQKVPFAKSHHRPYLTLMPLAIESLDLSKYDLIISDSASFAKGVITRPGALHICYCHTPTRYLWDDSHKYIREFSYPNLVKKFIPPFLNYLRIWDLAAADRPDYFIANSQFVAQRIKKYYKKDSVIIQPPIKLNIFNRSDFLPDNYFLAVSRFLPYKRLNLAIEAFNRLGWRLKIVGDGPEFRNLKKIAGPTIEFCGQVNDEKLNELYCRCRAFIFPQEEDFGIAAIEAMACGKPVIAFEAGGALEFVKQGETGLFFGEQIVDSLVGALKLFRSENFDPKKIREEALKYDKEIFKKKICEFIQDRWDEHVKNRGH